MPEQFPSLAEILAFLLPLLVAMTVHEVAHAIVARALGDRTAQEQGRVSLNPFRDIWAKHWILAERPIPSFSQ